MTFSSGSRNGTDAAARFAVVSAQHRRRERHHELRQVAALRSGDRQLVRAGEHLDDVRLVPAAPLPGQQVDAEACVEVVHQFILTVAQRHPTRQPSATYLVDQRLAGAGDTARGSMDCTRRYVG